MKFAEKVLKNLNVNWTPVSPYRSKNWLKRVGETVGILTGDDIEMEHVSDTESIMTLHFGSDYQMKFKVTWQNMIEFYRIEKIEILS